MYGKQIAALNEAFWLRQVALLEAEIASLEQTRDRVRQDYLYDPDNIDTDGGSQLLAVLKLQPLALEHLATRMRAVVHELTTIINIINWEREPQKEKTDVQEATGQGLSSRGQSGGQAPQSGDSRRTGASVRGGGGSISR
jgi:hypothetical protein